MDEKEKICIYLFCRLKEAKEEMNAELREQIRLRQEKEKEERQKEKEERQKEREKEREIRKEEKRIKMQYIKEWHRVREDLDCDDHKVSVVVVVRVVENVGRGDV